MGRIRNLVRNINYLMKHSLWDQREEDIVYLTNKILNDGKYEFNIKTNSDIQLNILDPQQSLLSIKNNSKSFVRTSDGEIKLMMGMDQPFQRYEQEIANRLISLLEHPRDDIYVGINRNYFIPLMPLENPPYYRRNAYDFRLFYLKHCNAKTVYIDATFTSYRIGSQKTPELQKFFNQWMELFADEDIVVVCGSGILDKLNHDVFQLAASKKLIEGPKRNAWDAHDDLIYKIKNTASKEQKLVFILGMAGKAMIPELAELGYTCWDVGHLAKYYNAYMTELPGTTENIADFYAPD